jgi:hypothetical protein
MMCLAVVVWVAMLVVVGLSATATVEEVAMAAAEEADEGQSNWWLCRVIYFGLIFF